MSLHCFHVYDGQRSFNTEGVECRGIREVRLHMLKIAFNEVMSANPQKETWSLEALNDQGVIGSMDFGLLSSTDYRR